MEPPVAVSANGNQIVELIVSAVTQRNDVMDLDRFVSADLARTLVACHHRCPDVGEVVLHLAQPRVWLASSLLLQWRARITQRSPAPVVLGDPAFVGAVHLAGTPIRVERRMAEAA